jgi:hypothetical protein
MGQNFISCDRGQVMLLPPSLTDWLPEDHLVWTMLAEQMDLDGFYGVYRANGQGRAAYDPARGSRHFVGHAFTSSSSQPRTGDGGGVLSLGGSQCRRRRTSSLRMRKAAWARLKQRCTHLL